MNFFLFLETTEHPVVRFRSLAEKHGWKYEPTRINKEPNLNALRLSNGTYPTIVSPDGVIVVLDASDRFLHNGYVWVGDDSYDINPNRLTIAAIVTPEHLRGKGLASKALKSLQQIADQLGMQLIGEPAQMKDFKGKKSLTKKQLINWYKKNNWSRKYDDIDSILQYQPKKID